MLKIIDGNFNNIVVHNNRCYAFTGIFKNIDITDEIKIVNLLGQEVKGTQGFVPIMTSFFIKPKTQAQCMITLNNDVRFTIETDDETLIKFLIPHMHVKRRGGR
jgi:hypothetical protein